MTHYQETGKEKAYRLRSSGSFSSSAICGNGQPLHHLKHTRIRRLVTCPACKEKLGIS